MPNDEAWKSIVASSLDWDQAHSRFDDVVKNLPANLRAKRPEGSPHSLWELVEHIRIVQHDLLDFCRNADYSHDLKWPDDYWPPPCDTITDEAWDFSLCEISSERDELKAFTTEPGRDLTAKIPHGTGQTYLRTILVALDHAAYHMGEFVAVRRSLGAWPAD